MQLMNCPWTRYFVLGSSIPWITPAPMCPDSRTWAETRGRLIQTATRRNPSFAHQTRHMDHIKYIRSLPAFQITSASPHSPCRDISVQGTKNTYPRHHIQGYICMEKPLSLSLYNMSTNVLYIVINPWTWNLIHWWDKGIKNNKKIGYRAKHYQIPIIVIYVLHEVLKLLQKKPFSKYTEYNWQTVLINWDMTTSRIVYKTLEMLPEHFYYRKSRTATPPPHKKK